MSKTPLLDTLQSPCDLHQMSLEQLIQLGGELRSDLITSISKTGGHLGASLGVVELTVALHAVFHTPEDIIIWDVGHQSYPHKILTGRRHRMESLRKPKGLSGFCKRSESPYDAFGAGHSSTSISAALGMAVARDLTGERYDVVAVIGDGAMSAGLAFEGLNNAGSLDSRLIIVLNDNDMSIAPSTGAVSDYLARVRNRRNRKNGTLFEQLGFHYVGPVDGHNLSELLPILENIKKTPDDGPVLLHVVTQKGYGYGPTVAAMDKGHSVASFDVSTGVQKKVSSATPSYTKVFAESLIKEAALDERIVAITAAMPSGTGLDLFGKAFPDRMFDVGIAEQHAVTFAAGMATKGYKPFCAIYSTFLQRAYDQIVHDVALQNLPVRFAIDRAGLVGADGPTHAGAFDIAYLCTLPNIVLMAASDEAELAHMVATAAAYNDGPIALRYPRGEGMGVIMPEKGKILPIGKGRIVQKGEDVALLSLGTRLTECLKAAQQLENDGIGVTVADARFAKPIDKALVRQLLKSHSLVLTVEEGSNGGFGAHVLSFAANTGLLDGRPRLRSLCLPDRFIEQNTLEAMYDEAGLNAEQIVAMIRSLVHPRAKKGIDKIIAFIPPQTRRARHRL